MKEICLNPSYMNSNVISTYLHLFPLRVRVICPIDRPVGLPWHRCTYLSSSRGERKERINKKKEGNENEKEKERMDTEQVVGTIILSMHGITDRNEILGHLHSEYMIEMCISILIERLLASIFDRENPPTILNASSNRCISISTLARLIFRRYTDFSLKRMIFHDQLTGSFTYHSIITTNPLLHER